MPSTGSTQSILQTLTRADLESMILCATVQISNPLSQPEPCRLTECGLSVAWWTAERPSKMLSASQGPICSYSCTFCNTEIGVADQTYYPTQSQNTDTWPTSPSTDPTLSGVWQGSPKQHQFLTLSGLTATSLLTLRPCADLTKPQRN